MDPVGAPAAAGMFTVDPAEVTIPAGGEVLVTVTADTRVPSPDGRYGGVLVATAGDLKLYVVRMARVCNGGNDRELWIDRVIAVPGRAIRGGREPPPPRRRCRGTG